MAVKRPPASKTASLGPLDPRTPTRAGFAREDCASGGAAMSSFLRILIVDDADIATLLQAKLTSFGHQVHVHHRAKGAVEAARECNAQLVILDVLLNDGLGYQVSRAIRSDPLIYKTPILFQSVIEDERDIRRAYADGADGFITKPYSLKTLTEHVDRMYALRHEMEQRCPITDFPSLTLLRREVDHRLFRDQPFALAYLFMDGLTAYQRSRANGAIAKVAASTALAIRETIKNAGFYETLPCHLGSGYFMVMLGIDDRRRFHGCVTTAFQQVLSHHDTPAIALSHEAAGAPASHFRLLVGITHTEGHAFAHAGEMFQALKKLENVSRRHETTLKKAAGHDAWVTE